MALPDENWPRWIFASVADYFKTAADDLNLKILIEGIDDREAEKIRAESHVELRIHGPETKEQSQGYFRLIVEINLLLTLFVGGEAQNPYDFVQWCGALQQAASGPIPIKRYGNGGDDDSELIGCLEPDPGRNEAVTVFHFGEIDRVRHVRQSAVDGRYRMYLSN